MSFLSTSQCPSHLAGSNKRQYNVCATCLSLGWEDKLHPFSEELMIILKHLLYEFDLDGCLKLVPPEKGIKLCNACLKTLQDIYFFKQKALESLNHLKKQREYCQTEQKTFQSLPEDAIVVTTSKVEVKEEPDPLETPRLIVFSHTTPEANESVDIKEESHIDNDHTNAESNESVDIEEESHIDNDNDDDHTNAEGNPDTESAESEDLEETIKESLIPKTVKTDVIRANSGVSSAIVKANSSFNLGNLSELIIKKNIESNNIQNTVRTLVHAPLKPDSPFRVTSNSSIMPVQIDKLSSSNVGPSALQVAESQPQGRREIAAKEQSDTPMARNNRPCSDTDSNSGAEKRKRKKYVYDTIPWYITDITREQLVKIREDLLKDPSFAKAVYKCLYCARSFKFKENWNQHKGHCHGRSKENAEFSCFVCGLRFDTLSLLSAHMRFHSAGHHTYQCPTCDYTTTEPYFVTRHRCANEGGEKVPPQDPTMKLASGRRQYYCPACEFVSFQVVNDHYHRFHTSPVKCDVCNKSIKNLASLRSHKNKYHSGQRPEKKELMFCAPCVKPFYSMAAYRAHMMTFKHAPKDQVNISCDECPKKFHLQELYEKHKRTHELIRSGAKPHKCTHCGLSYVKKSTLFSHIRTKHTEREIKRDHICEVCGDAFTNGVILRNHMAKHSDERPYKCEYCGDTFKYSGARYTHIKLKHNKKKTKPDDQNKGTRKSARNRKRRKEKGNKHEQSEDTHEHEQIMGTHEQSMKSHEQEQSVESSVYGGNMESLEDYDKILEVQNSEKSMEI